MVQERNLALYIILTIVTGGIFGLYWVYTLNEDTNALTMEEKPTSGGIVILLGIVTCGIYMIYWSYKQGERLDRLAEARGLGKGDRPILYLLLTLFGFGIVAYALMQDTLNKLCAAPAAYGQPQQPYYGQPQQPYYGQPQQPHGQQSQQPYGQQNNGPQNNGF